ncbi:glycerol-3-phosphate 1-O-acyltransferase PlsY [Wielerella bovis]|uniref:glycerol-3-phosphate 1-O-acyltransferase PlsY n=1 Tax=Wielerella bovis TaxID=2917790 RepID=UPI0020192CCF|nr:glycerol-3-phosphate 1-O-acyltransferase PlsY [Wielerella bovis]ULJ69871.1 glycerol-3-phosphate 1-O-acyltransferase PlsY [Wielerella bovis]
MFFLEIMVALVAYLIGSLSAALIVSKKLGMPDPRTYGSGNPGASNMLRSGNTKAAAWTLFGDALKGFVVVLLARCLMNGAGMPAGGVGLAAIAVVLGHMYPIFFGFRGGKGVATALGVLLGMSFWTTFWVVLIWAVIAFKFHKSSLAALIAAACAPFAAFIIIHQPTWGWSLVVVAALVIYRHRDNIKRIQSGTELGIGEPAKPLDSQGNVQSAATEKQAENVVITEPKVEASAEVEKTENNDKAE